MTPFSTMSVTASPEPIAVPRVVATVLPVIAVIFTDYLVIGMAMPVLPLNWGLAPAGPKNTGKVMAWVGLAIYVAYAAGASAGSALYTAHGFAAVALATTLILLLTLARSTA
jgi:predicted MFS family arabinose efflux permease